MPRDRSSYDRCVIRDDRGLLHNALLYRKFLLDGSLRLYQISTGCMPSPRLYIVRPEHRSAWPPVGLWHDNVWIIEWRVREAPTCLVCVTALVSV